MSTIELNLKRRPGLGNSIKIDGAELAGMVSHLELDVDAHTEPVLRLTLPAVSTAAIIDGRVAINAIPVSDAVGRAIYNSLRTRYEETAP